MKPTKLEITVCILASLACALIIGAVAAHADNYTFSQGSGKTAGSDTISTVEYPRMKLIHGADGVNDGDVSSANPLPVGGSGAAALGKVEDALHNHGDVGAMCLGVRNTSLSSFGGAQGEYTPLGVTAEGSLYTTIDYNNQPTPARGLLKQEDAGHTTSDAGVMSLGVRNETAQTLAATDLDYTPIAVTQQGAGISVVDSLFQINTGRGLLKDEDGSHASGHSGVMALGVYDSVASADAADNDYMPLKLNDVGALYVQNLPGIRNGLTVHRKISAASNNSTNVKNGAGLLYDISVCAGTAAAGFLKIYDKATAPTCGTDVPVMVLPLPATAAECQNFNSATGLTFSSGIGYCMVTLVADSDNTSVVANQMLLTLGYR